MHIPIAVQTASESSEGRLSLVNGGTECVLVVPERSRQTGPLAVLLWRYYTTFRAKAESSVLVLANGAGIHWFEG